MRLRTRTALAALALAPLVFAADTPKAGPRPDADDLLFSEALARSRSMSQPQPEHRRFEPLVGHYRVDFTTFSPGKGGSTHLTGTAENAYVLGGRFLRSEWSVGASDDRLDFITYLGYDNASKKYTLVGFSSLRTNNIAVAGDFDPSSGTWVLSGRQRDEASGGAHMSRNLLKMDTTGNYELRSYVDLPGRAPFKMAQVKFERQ